MKEPNRVNDDTKQNAGTEGAGVTIRDNGNTKFTPLETGAVRNSKGIMATATTRSGDTLTREPTGADLVRIGGMEMALAQAAQLGFVQEQDGKFSDLPEAELDAIMEGIKPKDRAADLTEALSVDDDTAEGLTDLAGALSEFGANPAGIVGELIARPDALPEAIKQLSTDRGIDEVAAINHVRNMAASVEDAIGSYVVERGGVSAEQLPAFWQYVMETIPLSKVAAMASNAVFVGDASPFRDLARKFVSAHGSGRGKATDKQIGTRKVGGESRDTVKLGNNLVTSLEAARRLKIA